VKVSKHIIISRTDSIGDVMLTLPICGVLKKHFPEIKITFLGRSYTEAIIKSCSHVDQFINWDSLSKESLEKQTQQFKAIGADTIIHVFPDKEVVTLANKAGIPNRIATGRRWHTLMNCNHPVFFSRKNSDLHESQLNIKLLQPLGITDIPTLAEIPSLYGFHANGTVPEKLLSILNNGKKNIILHPLSKGSAVNWSMSKFQELATLLDENKFNVFVSGTQAEGEKIRTLFSFEKENVHDITGMLNLNEFIAFISRCDALVAASTGPLHIASALGLKAIGLYSPKRPIHPGRWAPIGKNAHFLVAPSHPEQGELEISAEEVVSLVVGGR
jgi:ADP-heptose:LPS heptosyltransferase